MNITRAEAAALGRRQAQPIKQPGDLLAIFVAGKLKNPLNGSQWGGYVQSARRYRIEWKERVAQVVLEAGRDRSSMMVDPITLQHIHMLCHVHNRMDSDGLQAACKPIRDALVECGVVSGDAERDGHTWSYAQVIDRARRGVEIRVRLREANP